MFSTISILIIFVEIFAAGVLFTGAYVFMKKFLQESERSLLALGFIFLLFGLYVSGIISSQLLYNIGLSRAILWSVHKSLSAVLVAASLSVFLYGAEKRYVRMPFFSYFAFALAIALTVMGLMSLPNDICLSSLSMPAFETTPIVHVKLMWVFAWLVVSAGAFMGALRSKDPKIKRLEYMSGASALCVVIAYLTYFLCPYVLSDLLVLFSWIVMFVAFSCFLLANIISPDDELALQPFRYLRTRILIKLILIFVLMIVLIIEATTLATIAVSKNALSRSVIEVNRQIALEAASRINAYAKTGNQSRLADQVAPYIKQLGRARDRSIIVFDGDKDTVAYYDKETNDLASSTITPKKAIEAFSDRSGGYEFEDNAGIKLVGAYEPVPGISWGVLVSQPESVAYGEIRKVETTSLLFVIIGIIIASLAGVFFSKNIERSINSIIKGTEEVRRGNLDFEINTDSEDEIGHLAKEFNMMTTELKESQDHLIASEKLAALGTMAAGMAHEIKNPLVALRTFTQLLPMKWEDKEFRDKFASVIPPEIDKINKIAENLLKFGRPSKPEFKPINVETVLDEVLELVDNQIKKNNIRVSTKFVKTPKINADPNQLSQAFLNIIMNAIQAMKDGGELIVKTDVGHVIQLGKITKSGFLNSARKEIEASGNKIPMIFVEVTDSGPGISEENMKNMFDPFFTTKESGTGMGLPITLRIIEDHNGSIKLRSQIGKGTTFIIMLPPVEVSESEDQTI